AKALYQGARCHGAKNELKEAAALYARVEVEHASHSYADDARLRQAEMFDLLGEQARSPPRPPTPAGDPPGPAIGAAECGQRFEALLSDLADRYPNGDIRGEALFRLFFRAWKDRRLDDARRWLERE